MSRAPVLGMVRAAGCAAPAGRTTGPPVAVAVAPVTAMLHAAAADAPAATAARTAERRGDRWQAGADGARMARRAGIGTAGGRLSATAGWRRTAWRTADGASGGGGGAVGGSDASDSSAVRRSLGIMGSTASRASIL